MTTTILAPDVTPDSPTRTHTSPRSAALVAGIGYVLLFGLAVFANFFVREGLVVTDDAQATAINIAESNTLFRLGLVAFRRAHHVGHGGGVVEDEGLEEEDGGDAEEHGVDEPRPRRDER